MIELVDLLKTAGQFTIEYLWVPLAIWTIIALPLAVFMHRSDSLPAVYQYHSRVILLFALPLGTVAYNLPAMLSSWTQTATETVKFLVIQNPIGITATSSSGTSSWLAVDSSFWAGMLAFLLIAGALYSLVQLASSVLQLKRMEMDLNFQPLSQDDDLMRTLPKVDKLASKSLIAYSDEASIPFTYGWLTTKIVIPSDLRSDPEELAMAVQHELMHIKHRDYLLNSLLLGIKSVFWIHPLAHYLYNSSQDYREITCDSELLASDHFSKKRYAAFLFDLAQRKPQSNVAMSMAVKPSSLKKRIKIMSEQTFSTSKFRSSLLLTLVFGGLVVLAMACSDITNDGITKQEVEQTQSQVATSEKDNLPLMIVNGEVFANKDKVTRIKPKYIKNIHVLKGKEGTYKYGDKAKNGALEITLNNPEKALSDLKDEEMLIVQKTPPSSTDEVYMSAQNMPELNGGLASLQKKVNYPEEARKANEQGRVIVQFIVDKQGNVKDPQVIQGVSQALDEEAIRVVKQADFEPGTQDGEPVRVQYSLPITFKLSSGDNE